mmetsp:Transcript_80318/g.167274  ORF Transcript_80318/g.167274 Transcript_80318/m.167274 type:complete len:216 (+) Transcript_80318:389-1036(+)
MGAAGCRCQATPACQNCHESAVVVFRCPAKEADLYSHPTSLTVKTQLLQPGSQQQQQQQPQQQQQQIEQERAAANSSRPEQDEFQDCESYRSSDSTPTVIDSTAVNHNSKTHVLGDAAVNHNNQKTHVLGDDTASETVAALADAATIAARDDDVVDVKDSEVAAADVDSRQQQQRQQQQQQQHQQKQQHPAKQASKPFRSLAPLSLHHAPHRDRN